MEEIFTVQAEIAVAVVEELGVALGSSAPSSQEGTQLTDNLDAYHAYLRANNTLTQLGVLERSEMQICIALLNNAVAADPQFAEAYGLLARTHSGMVHFGWDQTRDRVELARVAMERAMELDPDNVQVQIGRGFYYYHGLKQYAQAREAFERASELQPGNSEIMVAIGYVLRREAKVAEAVKWFERALGLSPNDSSMLYDLGETLMLVRRYEEGMRYSLEAIRRTPDSPRLYGPAAWTLTLSGDGDGAQALLDRYPGEPSVGMNLAGIRVALVRRDYQRALELIDLCPESNISQFQVFVRELSRAEVLNAMGETDRVAETVQPGLRELELLLDAYPDHSNFVATAAVAKSFLGPEEAEKAVAEVRRSLELYPASHDSWMRSWRVGDLITVLTRAGRHEEAVDEIRDLLAQSNEVLSVDLLRNSPVYDSLRGREDFEALLRD
jgi:tetratricopeptide (TPR) repeat protein